MFLETITVYVFNLWIIFFFFLKYKPENDPLVAFSTFI